MPKTCNTQGPLRPGICVAGLLGLYYQFTGNSVTHLASSKVPKQNNMRFVHQDCLSTITGFARILSDIELEIHRSTLSLDRVFHEVTEYCYQIRNCTS